MIQQVFGQLADLAGFPLITEARYRAGEDPAASDLVGTSLRTRPGKSLRVDLLGTDSAFVTLTVDSFNTALIGGINVEDALHLGLYIAYRDTTGDDTGVLWISPTASGLGTDLVPVAALQTLTNPATGGPVRATGGAPPDYQGVITTVDESYQYADVYTIRHNRTGAADDETYWRYYGFNVAGMRTFFPLLYPTNGGVHTAYIGYVKSSIQ